MKNRSNHFVIFTYNEGYPTKTDRPALASRIRKLGEPKIGRKLWNRVELLWSDGTTTTTPLPFFGDLRQVVSVKVKEDDDDT